MTDIASLQFDVDSSDLKSANAELGRTTEQSGKATKATTKFGLDTEKSMQQAKRGALAIAAGFTAAAAAVAVLTKRGLSNVDNQAKLARSLGVTADGLRAVQLAASDAGIEGMDMSLNRLNRRLGAAANGNKEYKDTVDRLGLSLDELSEQDADERIASIADAVQRSGRSSQETARDLQKLGFEQAQANDFFRQGGSAIRAATQDVEDYGLSLNEIDTRQVEAANDAWARIGLVTEGIENQLAVQMAPAIQAVAELFTDSAKEAGGFGDEIESAVDMGVRVVAFLADSVEGVRRAFLLAGQGVAVFALSVTQGMFEVAEAIASGPIDMLNALIETANELGGFIGVEFDRIEQPAFVKEMQSDIKTLRGAVSEGVADMRRTLMKPLPGNTILEAFEDAKIAAEEAARAAADAGDSSEEAASGVRVFSSAAKDFLAQLVPANDQLDELVENAGRLDFSKLGNPSGVDEEDTFLATLERQLMDFEELSNRIIGNFSSEFGNALESVIFDFQSLDDAGKVMLESLLRGTVNALGQMAAQWLAYKAVQMATNAASGTAAATAMTSEALAAQQLAGIHAFSSTAAIPIVGPPAAPGAMAAALAATSPFVAAVGSLSTAMAGAQAASFDGGGFTGPGARSGGVDGKGGFPAILHPNETVIDHTRNQSTKNSNSTNVTQVFQMSDNVNREVKQQIAQAAPFIRAQARQAVLEAISQGGSMSKAVGRR